MWFVSDNAILQMWHQLRLEKHLCTEACSLAAVEVLWPPCKWAWANLLEAERPRGKNQDAAAVSLAVDRCPSEAMLDPPDTSWSMSPIKISQRGLNQRTIQSNHRERKKSWLFSAANPEAVCFAAWAYRYRSQHQTESQNSGGWAI